MRLLMKDVCEFGKCNPSSRNYVKGELVLNSKHLLFCDKDIDESTGYKIYVYCLQTSNMREKPHEIEGIINKNGSIESMKCSCKAGLSEKCKHVIIVSKQVKSIFST